MLPYTYYHSLSESDQRIYLELRKNLAEHNDQDIVLEPFPQDPEALFSLAQYDPLLGNLDALVQTGSNTVRGAYEYPQDVYLLRLKEMYDKTDEWVAAVQGLTDTEKLLYLHDKLADNCTITESAGHDNAYDCLIGGMADSEGYARAYEFICMRAGLDVFCIKGVLDGDKHVWNAVNHNNELYNIDCFCDDISGRVERLNFHYSFMVPDDDDNFSMGRTSVFDTPCCGKYDMAAEFDFYVDSAESFEKIFLAQASKAVDNGSNNFELRFSSGKLAEELLTDKKYMEHLTHLLNFDKGMLTNVYRFTPELPANADEEHPERCSVRWFSPD